MGCSTLFSNLNKEKLSHQSLWVKELVSRTSTHKIYMFIDQLQSRHQFTLSGFIVCMFAKLSSKSSVLSCLAASFSMTWRAKPSRLSCEIINLRYVFISLSFVKKRSALDTHQWLANRSNTVNHGTCSCQVRSRGHVPRTTHQSE